MSNITYRLATANDTPLLIAYRLKLLLFVSTTSHTDDEIDTLTQQFEAYFPKAINEGTYIAWIAECDGQTAAVSGMVVYDRPAGFRCPTGRVGYILGIYTEPEYRRRGICGTLMGKLEQSAREHNITTMAMHATEEGERVYRKNGFKEPGSLVLEKHL
ncbi:MAG: GNAT family N-acetyltransferase [Bacteroidetes bacterium]|nr:GNAT family N-acetyltransferase [Bacteroidota bacterium]